MNTILLCNSDSLAIPAALYLHQNMLLAAVVIPKSATASLRTTLEQVQVPADKIYVTERKQLSGLLSRLIQDCSAALVVALTFPWRLPDDVLSLPAKGCINFHFGLLPVYQGADPVFWQLKNGEKEGGIAVHYMTAEVDGGPVLIQSPLPLMPGETYGIHCERLGHAAVPLLQQLITQLQQNTAVATGQVKTPAAYWYKPDARALTIQWQQHSAAEIIQLVNACNPCYGGAVTRFREMEVAVMEVLPIDITNPPAQVVPGTIVHADAVYGIIAACADGRYIRITVVQLREGYLSGSKLVQMGWQAGERFVS